MYMGRDEAEKEVEQLRKEMSHIKGLLSKCTICGIRQLHLFQQCCWEEGQGFVYQSDTVSINFLIFINLLEI